MLNDLAHALDLANRSVEGGSTEARRSHTMPGTALAFTKVPSGVLCFPFAAVPASELPDPGWMGTAR